MELKLRWMITRDQSQGRVKLRGQDRSTQEGAAAAPPSVCPPHPAQHREPSGMEWLWICELFNHHPALPSVSGRRFSCTVTFDQSPEKGISQCNISVPPWQAPGGCCCISPWAVPRWWERAVLWEQRTPCVCSERLCPSCHTLFCAHLPQPPGDTRAGLGGLEELDFQDRAVGFCQHYETCRKSHVHRFFCRVHLMSDLVLFFLFFCFISVLAPQLAVL